MRAGDTVFHRPTGETWTLAYVDGETLAWCGWPEGLAYTRDCELREACSDAEHLEMLKRWADKDYNDHRVRVCRRLLAAQ